MDDIINTMDQEDLLLSIATTTTTPSLNPNTYPPPTTCTTRNSTHKKRTYDNDDSDSSPSSTQLQPQKRLRLPSPFTLQAERLEEALNREIQAQEDEITMHRYRMLNRRVLNEAHDRMFRFAMIPDQARDEEYNLQLRRCYELQRREEVMGDGDMDVDVEGEVGDGNGNDREGEEMVVSSAGATANSSPVHRTHHVHIEDNVAPMRKKGCLTGVGGSARTGMGEFAIYEDQETGYDVGVNHHEVDADHQMEGDALEDDAEEAEELEYADTEVDPMDEALGDQLRRRRSYGLRQQRQHLASHAEGLCVPEASLNPLLQSEALGDEGSQSTGVGRGRRGTRRL